MRKIITLVGASVLFNGKRELKVDNPDAAQLLDYLRNNDVTRVSAETNSLQYLFHEDDGIIFVHSDTPEGHLCAEVLDQYYSYGKHGQAKVAVNSIELCVIPQLNYSERRFKLVGLRSLVNTLSLLIRREERVGNTVLINATAGFKAETAYANLIGILFKIPVYYLYESFNEIIEFPPFPVDLDLSLVKHHYEFFTWIDGEPRKTSDVSKRLHNLEPSAQIILAEEGDYTFLSPIGEALLQVYRNIQGITEEIAPPSISNKVPEDKLRFVRDEPNQPKGTLAFSRRLAGLEYVEEVRGGEFLNTAKTRIQQEFKDKDKYKIKVIFSDGDKGVYLTATTTAQSAEQNSLVRKHIEELMET